MPNFSFWHRKGHAIHPHTQKSLARAPSGDVAKGRPGDLGPVEGLDVPPAGVEHLLLLQMLHVQGCKFNPLVARPRVQK